MLREARNSYEALGWINSFFTGTPLDHTRDPRSRTVYRGEPRKNFINKVLDHPMFDSRVICCNAFILHHFLFHYTALSFP